MLGIAYLLGRLLTYTEDDKLSRFYRGDTYLHHEFSIINVRLGRGGPVALDKKCLRRFCSLQGTIPPNSRQEIRNRSSNSGPGGLIIGFEYHPLSSFFDAFLNEDEETADAYILPVRIAGDATSTPDSISSPTFSQISQNVYLIRRGG